MSTENLTIYTPFTMGNQPPTGVDYWTAEDPDYPVEDWQYQVNNNDTRLGYWDWVLDEKEANDPRRV